MKEQCVNCNSVQFDLVKNTPPGCSKTRQWLKVCKLDLTDSQLVHQELHILYMSCQIVLEQDTEPLPCYSL